MELESSDLKRRVLHNTSAVVVGRAANLLLSLIPSVLLVRYLGTESLGQYASLYAYLALFSWLPTFGMDQILVRQAAQSRDEAGKIIGTGVLLALHLGGLAALVALVGSRLLGYAAHVQGLLILAAVDILLLAPLRLPGVVFQLSLKQGYSVAITTARQAAWAAGAVLLVIGKAGLPAVIVVRVLCALGEAVATYLLARRVVAFTIRWHGEVARRVLRDAWPMGLALLGLAIQQRIDQVLLRFWMGNVDLGYYVAAVNISELFSIVPAAVMSTMLPILSTIAGEEERFRRYVGECFRYLSMAGFGICVVITLASGFVVHTLYGDAYGSSAPILAVLIWSSIASFLGGTLTVVLIASGQQRLIPLSTAAGAVLNVALNAVLIPRAGGVGAAWASVLSYNLTGFCMFALIPATRHATLMGFRASFVPLAVSIAVVTGLAGLPVWLASLLGPLLYVVTLGMMGSWKRKDLKSVFGAFRPKAPAAS